MKRQLAAAVMFSLIVRSTAFGIGPDAFPFYKELTPPVPLAGNIGGIIVDDDVLLELNDGRTNLRLMDANGKEVPFLLRTLTRSTTVTQETSFAAQIVSFRELPDNRVEIIVSKRTNDPAPSAVLLDNSQQNFEKRVTVSGSDDQKRWTELAADRPIYDYSRYVAVRNSRVDMEPRPFLFYRIDISNIAEDHSTALKEIIRQVKGGASSVTEKETAQIRKELFRVDRITFIARKEVAQEADPLLRVLDPVPVSVDLDTNKQATILQLFTKRQPLVSMSVIAKEFNFSRRVTVWGTDDDLRSKDVRWSIITAAIISRIEAGSIRQEQLKIGFQPAQRFRTYRLAIENQDNPPLTINGIIAEAEIWETLFYQQEPLPSRLCYGGACDQPARYDIGAVLASVSAREARAWSVGAQAPNPAYKPPSRLRSWQGRSLMVAAIAAMVLLLVRLIARTAKQVDQV